MSTTTAPAKKEEKKAAAPVPAPESLLKKRKQIHAQSIKLKIAKLRGKQRSGAMKTIITQRAEKYLKEYRNREHDLIRLRRLAKQKGGFFREPESKLLLVIRIRGINGMAPRTRKILRLLRLRQVHNAVFIRVNKAVLSMIRLVEPYVAYGIPSLKTVREMIYKRGFSKAPGQRRPLTDNGIVQKYLGKFGLVCIEDLIHEIYTVGPHFKQANSFLWPFKLVSPRGGLVCKGKHFVEGGDAGDRDVLINKLVRRMI